MRCEYPGCKLESTRPFNPRGIVDVRVCETHFQKLLNLAAETETTVKRADQEVKADTTEWTTQWASFTETWLRERNLTGSELTPAQRVDYDEAYEKELARWVAEKRANF